ncbi:MAG: prealbumin-like fold domain-containing protein [Clostridium fessum]
MLTYDLTVPNETTKIKISKLDFDTGLFVSGAKLAVYEAGFLDGVYTEAGEALETWICDGKTHVIEGRLIAGHTYLLKELEAPDGYTVQKPMIFTVSDTGRGINAARDGANALETETADGLFDSITSLQVQGRKALRLVRTLWDLDSGEEFVLSSLMEVGLI